MKIMRRFFDYFLLAFAGAGLGIYLFQSGHFEAILASVSNDFIPARLYWRLFFYCFSGAVFISAAAMILRRIAIYKHVDIYYANRIKYGFYSFLILFSTILSVRYPGLRIFFQFLFVGVAGVCSAWIACHMNCQPKLNARRSIIFLGTAICFYILFFSLLSIQRHKVFMTHALDLGVFTQTLWGYSKGWNLINTVVFEPMYLLGDHFSPITFLFVPFYWLWTDPRILLIIQSVYLGLGAIPLYFISLKLCKNSWLSLAIALTYLLFPGLHGINMADFHYITLCTPLLFLLFLMNQTGNRNWFYILLILLLFIREDVSFHIFYFGLYLIIFTSNRLRGLIVSAMGIVWFYIVISIFIPYFNSDNPRFHMEIYSHIGSNVPEMIGTMLFHPLKIIQFLAEDAGRRIIYILHLSMQMGFGYLFSLGSIFLILPSTLFNLFSNFPGQYTIKGQYTAPVIPFLFISSLYGFNRLAG
ncbi:MAG: hypothetical protein A2161_00960, partial [Candidatus Schekmanbacteria bacterium RBG_13_48_7]